MKHVWLSYRQPHEAHVETEAQEGPATCPRGQSVCLEGVGPPAASKVTASSCLLVRQDASGGAERAACGQDGVKRRAGLWGGTPLLRPPKCTVFCSKYGPGDSYF